MLPHLKIYNPRDNKYIEAKNNLVNNASKFYEGTAKIIEGFKNEIFPVYYDEVYEYQKKLEKKQNKK